MSEALILAYDPFAGDDGDSRVLSDKMVTTRKKAKCHQCRTTIRIGQRVRSRAEAFDGELMSFKWCPKCCELMAKDDIEGLEARFKPTP